MLLNLNGDNKRDLKLAQDSLNKASEKGIKEAKEILASIRGKKPAFTRDKINKGLRHSL